MPTQSLSPSILAMSMPPKSLIALNDIWELLSSLYVDNKQSSNIPFESDIDNVEMDFYPRGARESMKHQRSSLNSRRASLVRASNLQLQSILDNDQMKDGKSFENFCPLQVIEACTRVSTSQRGGVWVIGKCNKVNRIKNNIIKINIDYH